MQVIRKTPVLRKKLSWEREQGKKIGFVPTMGYFHEAHLTLMRWARKMCPVVVVSLFINPTQFGPEEDLDGYPRDFERDKKMVELEEVDYLFAPSADEMYPNGYLTYVDVEKITDRLCGQFRSGHFRGVATVVAKLFNIVEPDVAFFGEKDFQQLQVIKQMVRDLNFNVEVVGVPTVREEDGLAMSSRNLYLSKRERQAALVLSRSLKLARSLVEEGEQDTEVIKETMLRVIGREPLVKLQYLSICNPKSFDELTQISGEALVALAAKVGKARLIDNTLVRSPKS